MVVSDEGFVWIGPAAFLTALWALCEWREWSYRLSGPTFAPLAERFFKMISKRRKRLADFFPHHDCEGSVCSKRRNEAYR